MSKLSLTAVIAIATTACAGSDPRDFVSGAEAAIVERPGDQIHPSLDGQWLAWFDLEDDPNGACHVPATGYDGEYDATCDGVVRVMNLVNGRIQTVSEITPYETAPVVSNGLVAWLCYGDAGQGLCVTPADRKQVEFLPEVGWSRYYWNNPGMQLAASDGRVVWAEYRYQNHDPVFRILRASLRDGEQEVLAYLDRFPTQVAAASGLVAWSGSHWEDGETRYHLDLYDTRAREQRVLVDGNTPVFGLDGADHLLAWKQGARGSEDGVHVHYLDGDDEIRRADSPEAMVSAETPVAVGDDLLVWLDHREGPYQITGYDLNNDLEGSLSGEEAVLSAYMPPAVSGHAVVWPDLRNGDWDLYLFRL